MGKKKCIDDCAQNTDMYYTGGTAQEPKLVSARDRPGVSRS
jgi:hypothetical protein